MLEIADAYLSEEQTRQLQMQQETAYELHGDAQEPIETQQSAAVTGEQSIGSLHCLQMTIASLGLI